jgi:hypothetical protein
MSLFCLLCLPETARQGASHALFVDLPARICPDTACVKKHRASTPFANRLSGSWWCAVMCLGLAVAAAGCAQIQVSSVSPDPQRPVYELRGATLAHLQTEAASLCPHGFDVLRQSETDTKQPGGNVATRWWNQALTWVEDSNRQAQLAIACKAANR